MVKLSPITIRCEYFGGSGGKTEFCKEKAKRIISFRQYDTPNGGQLTVRRCCIFHSNSLVSGLIEEGMEEFHLCSMEREEVPDVDVQFEINSERKDGK